MGFDGRYHLIIKHGNGQSLINGVFNRKIADKWSICQHAMVDFRRVNDEWLLTVLSEHCWVDGYLSNVAVFHA